VASPVLSVVISTELQSDVSETVSAAIVRATWTRMVEVNTVSETSDFNSAFKRLLTRKCFIAFSRRESFESYVIDLIRNRLYFVFLFSSLSQKRTFRVGFGLYVYLIFPSSTDVMAMDLRWQNCPFSKHVYLARRKVKQVRKLIITFYCCNEWYPRSDTTVCTFSLSSLMDFYNFARS
jgi:hypothetical protein